VDLKDSLDLKEIVGFQVLILTKLIRCQTATILRETRSFESANTMLNTRTCGIMLEKLISRLTLGVK